MMGWIGIMVLQAFHESAPELSDTFEGAASDAFLSDLGRETFNHVELRRRGRV
jgi:hypothetical protein